MARCWLLFFVLLASSESIRALYITREFLSPERTTTTTTTTESPTPNKALSAIPAINITSDAYSDLYDAVVVVTDKVGRLSGKNLDAIKGVVQAYLQVDHSFGGCPSVTLTSVVPSARLVYVSVGNLDGDDDDVRQFATASSKGVGRALSAGSRRPLLVCLPPDDNKSYSSALLVAILGTLQKLYQPLSVREADTRPPVDALGVWHSDDNEVHTKEVVRIVQALEAGRVVARDVCAGDPEVMAPPKVEAYLRQVFAHSNVELSSADSQSSIQRDFPLVAAVARATRNVTRHHPRVLKLSYRGPGEANRTLLFAGKGVTYDSGGLDIKYGGSMQRMSRDKCGAASVAGIIMTLSMLRPPGVHVIGALPLVRNGVGAEGFASDEVIIARSGVSIRIRNTDAEGRLILADVLSRLKDIALKAPNPYIMSIATLTGHAQSAGGSAYSMLLDNGPAHSLHTAQRLQETGDKVGDPFEVSRIRREDFSANEADTDPEATLFSLPKGRGERGHQKAAAFLLMASGLDKYGSDSHHRLPFSHVDIAGPATMAFPKSPQAAPVIAVSTHFGLTTDEKKLLGLSTEEAPPKKLNAEEVHSVKDEVSSKDIDDMKTNQTLGDEV